MKHTVSGCPVCSSSPLDTNHHDHIPPGTETVTNRHTRDRLPLLLVTGVPSSLPCPQRQGDVTLTVLVPPGCRPLSLPESSEPRMAVHEEELKPLERKRDEDQKDLPECLCK